MSGATVDIRNVSAFTSMAVARLAEIGMPAIGPRDKNGKRDRSDYSCAYEWTRGHAPHLTQTAIDRATRILRMDRESILYVLTGLRSLDDARSAQARAGISVNPDVSATAPSNGRNISAFMQLSANRARSARIENRNDQERLRAWVSGSSIPPITNRAMSRAATILQVSIEEIETALCGGPATSIYKQRALEQRIKARGDMNADGTYNRVCRWCERHFVSPYGQSSPTCADCYGGNEAYRKREALESGKVAQWRANYREANAHREQELRDRKNSLRSPRWRRDLKEVNRAITRLERSIGADVRRLYRKAYLDHRRSIAHLIEKDNCRRKAKRRRAVDPCANRGTERNWWVFDVYKDYGYVCAYCGMTREAAKAEGFDFQADHIIPIGHPCCAVGPINCAPACIHCNSSKGNRDLITWAASKGYTPHPLAVARYNELMARVPMRSAHA